MTIPPSAPPVLAEEPAPTTAKYRKKPVVIDAFHFDGTNYDAVFAWVDTFEGEEGGPGMWEGDAGSSSLIIATLEGDMRASAGDWIIRGVQGEFYACKPDIFAATYEPADAALLAQARQGREDAERLREALQSAVRDFDNGIPASEDGDGMFFKDCGWVDEARDLLAATPSPSPEGA